jgi:hypothetical protein
MTGLRQSIIPRATSAKVGGSVPGAARNRSLFQGQDSAVLRARKPLRLAVRRGVRGVSTVEASCILFF